MSRYAYLTCPTCRMNLWLGKTVFEGKRIDRFHIGDAESVPNSEKQELNRALWKFLADHAGHRIRVLLEGDEDFDETSDYVEIGGDKISDVPLDAYLTNWKG